MNTSTSGFDTSSSRIGVEIDSRTSGWDSRKLEIWLQSQLEAKPGVQHTLIEPETPRLA
jgi:hypothetical protein